MIRGDDGAHTTILSIRREEAAQEGDVVVHMMEPIEHVSLDDHLAPQLEAELDQEYEGDDLCATLPERSISPRCEEEAVGEDKDTSRKNLGAAMLHTRTVFLQGLRADTCGRV